MRFNRSSATIPLPTQVDANAGENLEEFQSLKRDHSSSDSATISQMSSRRFQSLKRDHSSSDIAILFQPGLWMREFQSLKRDHSSSDLKRIRDGKPPPSKVSIAQARPFLFRLRLRICCSGQRKCFNRSSATIPLPTPLPGVSRDVPSSGFNRSSATIPLPTAARQELLRGGWMFQSLKRDHSSSDAYPPPVESLSYLRFNRSSATIPLPTASFRKASRNVMN